MDENADFRAPSRFEWTVALPILAWVAGTLVLAWLAFAHWFSFEPLSEQERALAVRYTLALGLVFAGGPIAVALVARIARMMKTARVFLAIGAVLSAGVCGLILLAQANEPEPYEEPEPPGFCVEHSGGDNRCPGG